MACGLCEHIVIAPACTSDHLFYRKIDRSSFAPPRAAIVIVKNLFFNGTIFFSLFIYFSDGFSPDRKHCGIATMVNWVVNSPHQRFPLNVPLKPKTVYFFYLCFIICMRLHKISTLTDVMLTKNMSITYWKIERITYISWFDFLGLYKF